MRQHHSCTGRQQLRECRRQDCLVRRGFLEPHCQQCRHNHYRAHRRLPVYCLSGLFTIADGYDIGTRGFPQCQEYMFGCRWHTRQRAGCYIRRRPLDFLRLPSHRSHCLCCRKAQRRLTWFGVAVRIAVCIAYKRARSNTFTQGIIRRTRFTLMRRFHLHYWLPVCLRR